MLFMFQHRRPPYLPGGSPFGSSLLCSSLFCLLFGLAILAAPDLLAHLVAGFLLLLGLTLFLLWWRLR